MSGFHEFTCEICDTPLIEEGYVVPIYTTPWAEKPELHHFCGRGCAVEAQQGDLCFDICDRCGKAIRTTSNTAQGEILNFRTYSLWEETICLNCYHEEILLNGQLLTDFTDRPIISGGMFFDEHFTSPENAGYKKFTLAILNTPEDILEYNRLARSLVGNGYAVITNYETFKTNREPARVSMCVKKIEGGNR